MKTEQCKMKVISKATERFPYLWYGKRKNFNCGTTSERMKGNDYNFKSVKPA